MAYEIFKSEKSGKFHWRLKAKNGQIILASEAYENKQGAKNGIESTTKNGQKEKQFEAREAKDGQSYFVLKATNGEIIGRSEMYKTKQSMNKGIQSVLKNASGGVKDLTTQ